MGQAPKEAERSVAANSSASSSERQWPKALEEQRVGWSKRTTSWQAENDGWRVRGKRQQRKKVAKMRWHVIKYKGVMAKAPPCPERTTKTPMPQQSSPSSRDEESQWVAVEDRRRRRVAFEETARGCTEIPRRQ